MIGTMFLWICWPSFNAALAAEGGQVRAVINTLLSLTTAVSAAVRVSDWHGQGKIDMVIVQNSTLAGGVAMGTLADFFIYPFGAMLVGLFAGTLSALGFIYATPWLRKRGLHDTCGIFNLHFMPGITGGVCAAIAAAASEAPSTMNSSQLNLLFPARVATSLGGNGYTASMQGGYQAAYLLMALGIALVLGLGVGLLIRLPWFEPPQNHYEDSSFFVTSSLADKDSL